MLTLNEKKYNYKNSNRVCGKKMSNIFITLKKTCLGVLEWRRYVTKTMKQGLKEGGGIEMSTTVLPFTITIITSTKVIETSTTVLHSRCTLSFALKYSPLDIHRLIENNPCTPNRRANQKQTTIDDIDRIVDHHRHIHMFQLSDCFGSRIESNLRDVLDHTHWTNHGRCLPSKHL